MDRIVIVLGLIRSGREEFMSECPTLLLFRPYSYMLNTAQRWSHFVEL